MTPQTEGLRYETDGTTAYVTFDRPEKHNSLTPEMMQAGARAIHDADGDDEVRAIVVTGAGEEAFCTGADLEETIPEATGPDPDIEPDEDDLFLRHDLVRTPVIAAVNGLCVAGGMEFLQATDIRVAAESARFGLQEPRWGIAPIAGSHVRLPRQIPYCRAMEFLLTGDLFPAAHALDAGLVNEVVPDEEVLERAEAVAESIAENSPEAVQRIKETVHRCAGRRPDDAFRLETQLGKETFASAHADEGVQAFREGREPSFRR
ncbi:enoyl-CoA hydratase/isomerase family protein [Salinirussus salinus]|uniref:enoyl-CoA hydratase/isomerase family protein n=1 Tax=Salinirussus salinus TaxID=1198300 RepID=UPI00135CABC5|nr:enoyl-CoA hydratase-related protein [Salinirussus salinus]